MGNTRDGFRVAAAVFRPALLAYALCLAAPELRALLPQAGVDAQETTPDATAGGDASDGQGAEARPGAPRVDARESFFSWMARASGPIGLVIAAMSFYLFALVVWMALRYRTDVAMPRRLVREVQDLLEHKKYSEAYHRVAADDSLLARVLAAGVRKLPSGLPLAQRAMELANEDATMEMEHRTTYLATVGTLGPMIGLVGTVYGMIMAFRVIALEGSSPQASAARRRHLDGALRHPRGHRHLDPGHLLLLDVPQPDRAALAGGGDGGRAVAGAVRAGIRAPEAGPAQPQPQPPPAVATAIPMGGPTSHPHPYAASAALAAGPGTGASRSALPPTASE